MKPLAVRPAREEHLDAIIALTRASRRQLAEWSPIYFNPRVGADENHANFIRFMVGSEDHETLVLADDEQVVGFFAEIPQEGHLWIDDLCVSSQDLWPRAVEAIDGRVDQRWVTCVSVADTARLHALATAGVTEVSAYFSMPIEPTGSLEPAPVAITDYQPAAASHTFGGRAFSPELPGALVVATDAGYVVGSPSVSPPIYDPGGPTCVIDQIYGDDPRGLLEEAIALSAGRGDHHLIVVCDTSNDGLAQTLVDIGFTKVVSLQGRAPVDPFLRG